MKVEFVCRRCAGRRKLQGEDECFVCLGKGVIKVETKDLAHYHRIRRATDKL